LAIETLERLLEKASQAGATTAVEKYRLSLSSCYKKLGQYTLAIQQQQELLKIFSSETSSAEYALIHNNIGVLQSEQKDHTSAIASFEKAIAYCPIHLHLYSEIILNLAASQFKQKREQPALDNIDKGISASIKNNDAHTLCLSLALKSQILNSLGKLSDAIGTAHQALSAAEATGDPVLKSETYALLAMLTAKADDHISSAEFTKFSAEQKILVQKNALAEVRNNEELNAQINSKEKTILNSIAAEQEQNILLEQELVKTRKEKEFERLNYEKGLQEAALRNEQIEREKALKELALVQSALVAEQQLRTISDLEKIKAADQLKVNELSFAKEEKEKDLQLLRKQNDLLEADQKLRDAESKRDAVQRRFVIVAALLLFILLCLAIISVVSTRKKNHKIKLINATIQDINEKLNTKNNEIISSIEYAKNFQSMIIPSEASFAELASDGLLLYRPMEIVSGDIPFVIKKGNTLYVAAIDCIGHGVPAAMLTFMAYYNLQSLIDDLQASSCADMLHSLHKKMSEAVLKKNGEVQFNSGIDISLCKIDLNLKQLEFAGANSPILLATREGIERINGNSFSVGDTLNDRPALFENHLRSLQESDRIYLFSDGLIHQFGGNGRQKFSLKRLSSLLSEAHTTPMIEVQKTITRELDNWQGSCDQTDDIMLIGLEI
jgi:serine phosphatase RsbU (regulator of sigma subunit)